MNPIIVLAVIAQMALRNVSQVAGALAGFAITTGILLWGIALYGGGDQISFFGIPLSEPVFLWVCAMWYGFDVRALRAARRAEQAVSDEEPAPTTPA